MDKYPTEFWHIWLVVEPEVQNGTYFNFSVTQGDMSIQESITERKSIIAYMIREAVELWHAFMPQNARLQAALETQQAS